MFSNIFNDNIFKSMNIDNSKKSDAYISEYDKIQASNDKIQSFLDKEYMIYGTNTFSKELIQNILNMDDITLYRDYDVKNKDINSSINVEYINKHGEEFINKYKNVYIKSLLALYLFDPKTIDRVIYKKNSNGFNMALMYGNIETVKYMFNNGFSHDINVFIYAICGHNIDCIKYLIENNFKPDYRAYCACIKHNANIEIYDYLCSVKCELKSEIYELIIDKNNIELFKYFHKIGCPINDKICSLIVCNGRINMLKFIHENGIPWTKNTCLNAAKSNQLECLKYAHKNGCPFNKKQLLKFSFDNNIRYYIRTMM